MCVQPNKRKKKNLMLCVYGKRKWYKTILIHRISSINWIDKFKELNQMHSFSIATRNALHAANSSSPSNYKPGFSPKKMPHWKQNGKLAIGLLERKVTILSVSYHKSNRAKVKLESRKWLLVLWLGTFFFIQISTRSVQFGLVAMSK